MSLTKKQINNFWTKVKKTDSCWLWMRRTDDITGYGRVNINGHNYNAHRIAWMITFGEIPDNNSYHGICVLHKCDNRKCVNPNHLFLGTQKDNMRDAKQKHRLSGKLVGEKNGRSKLTWNDVAKIKSLIGTFTYKEIAKQFKVAITQIHYIKYGKTWSIT